MSQNAFVPPTRRGSPYPFDFDWYSGFGEEDLRKWRTMTNDDDNGRTPEHAYTISSPCEPDGSGEFMPIKSEIQFSRNSKFQY